MPKAKFLEQRMETGDCSSFIFEKPPGFSYQAGQFMFFVLEHQNPDERGVRRHFTISTSPTEEHLMLTTKFADPSSSYKIALRTLAPGSEVPIMGPGGEFVLPEDPNHPVTFLGGGIGITPFRSMIKFVIDNNLPTPITLLYASKTPADIVYKNEFDEWAKEHANFKPVYIVDEGGEDWKGETGRLTPELIKKYVEDVPGQIFYICGPPPMVEAYAAMIKQSGATPEQIKVEHFTGYS